MILSDVLAAYQRQEELSVRQLSKRIGMRNYSTLWRFIEGRPCTAETIQSVLLWMLSDNSDPSKSRQPATESEQLDESPEVNVKSA